MHNIVMLRKEKWEWKKLQIKTWWTIYYKSMVGSNDKDVKIWWKNTQQRCEVEKCLKHYVWVMGHGWGLHGGTWKMGI
jgi:hypothetical protein